MHDYEGACGFDAELLNISGFSRIKYIEIYNGEQICDLSDFSSWIRKIYLNGTAAGKAAVGDMHSE